MRPRLSQLRPWALLAFALILSFWRLGDGSLYVYDEGTTALRIHEMSVTGDLLIPTTSMRPDYNKPPLYYWISLPLYRALGPGGEFAIRFWSVVFALGAAAMVRALVRRGGAPAWSADLSAALVVLTPLWYELTRMGHLDSGFALSWLVALWFLDREGDTRVPLRGAVFAGLALALGALLKSPLTALVVPAVLLADRIRGRPLDLRAALIAGGIGLGVFAVYTGVVVWIDGPDFVAYQRFNYVDRFTRPIWGRDIPPAMYARVAMRDALPILLAALLALRLALGVAPPERRKASWMAPALLFVTWLTLSLLMVNRRSIYLVPLIPLAATCLGLLLPRLGTGWAPRVALILAVGATLHFAFHFDAVHEGSPLAKAAGVYLAGHARAGESVASSDLIYAQVLSYYARHTVETVRPGDAHKWARRHRDADAGRGWFLVPKKNAAVALETMAQVLLGGWSVERAFEEGSTVLFRVDPRPLAAPD
jgi:4-amino-4-deoxy-L-arabinose transferase-like glycosyltransferase